MRSDRRVSFRRAMMWLARRKPVAPIKSAVPQRPRWTDHYAQVCHWYYVQEWANSTTRKNISQLGGHFMDWAITEAVSRGGLRCREYRVVYNQYYRELYEKYAAHLNHACLNLWAIDISSWQGRSTGQIGDTFEVLCVFGARTNRSTCGPSSRNLLNNIWTKMAL